MNCFEWQPKQMEQNISGIFGGEKWVCFRNICVCVCMGVVSLRWDKKPYKLKFLQHSNITVTIQSEIIKIPNSSGFGTANEEAPEQTEIRDSRANQSTLYGHKSAVLGKSYSVSYVGKWLQLSDWGVAAVKKQGIAPSQGIRRGEIEQHWAEGAVATAVF